MKTQFIKYILLITALLITIVGCSDSYESLTSDFNAGRELPPNLTPGTPLTDRVLELYDTYGVIVYTDTIGDRNFNDIVSEDPLQIGTRIPADTAAALVYLDMIEKEFIQLLPEDKKKLVFRNFYLYQNQLISGTSAYTRYEYLSQVWSNSSADLTVGGIDNENLDSTQLKQTFYYGLSDVLRMDPFYNANYFGEFIDIKTEAAVYYWQVTSLELAYEKGFLTANQNLIKSDSQDFNLYAAWAVTVEPTYRDSILNKYPLVRQKYNLVDAMFRQEGISLEGINEQWQISPFNPNN